MSSPPISPDSILEGKGRGEYAGAHLIYSKCKHKFNTEKKGMQGSFQQTENKLIQSQCRNGYWLLTVWWETHTFE